MRQIRLAYPRTTRIYWIQDNLSCHWTPAIRDYLDWDSFALAIADHIRYRNEPDRRRERLERGQNRLRVAA